MRIRVGVVELMYVVLHGYRSCFVVLVVLICRVEVVGHVRKIMSTMGGIEKAAEGQDEASEEGEEGEEGGKLRQVRKARKVRKVKLLVATAEESQEGHEYKVVFSTAVLVLAVAHSVC